MKPAGWILCALLFALLSPASRAEDRIWTALVLATNEQPPKPPPKPLAPFQEALGSIFGYNTLYLLGEKKQRVRVGNEEWVLPTKEVFLKVRSLSRDATSYTVEVQLYVRRKLVVTSTARLAREAPLYIRGPAWGRGRLVFILEIR